ncbi:uncharacterized protein (DUF302 family) [Halanaerobium congolense]|uniref:Uncharacterized protein (DUF302 family) n=1 Tax=Halanaerobium congolense TaxID=54121 RepID=A0A4R8GE84_9FIRM|nr:DUF302 domain-containing protein [Halanaerobium congolense]TDX35501.1 uncharacterized protein (DUF302 family) [Halanaerobium congolense]
MSNYSFSKKVDLDFNEAIEKLKAELKKEGFGILTEIDVKKTVREKLDKDFNRYQILGACNPNFAFKALKKETEIGLLLPCNVIVYENDAGETIVAAVDASKALGITDNDQLKPIAEEVSIRLKRVVSKV